MVLLLNDAYFASGFLPADEPWLIFMAKVLGGVAVNNLGEFIHVD